MTNQDIQKELFSLQDVKYRDFQAKLMPTLAPEKMIGVRTPELRKLAKKLAKEPDIDLFLDTLPHDYFDENQLHAFIISEMKDYDKCLERLNEFLPYVDNWATCDQMSPKIFKKHKMELVQQIEEWIESDYTYTVRFAIGMLMEHFLDDEFDIVYTDMVADVHSEEYYINMMIAWYFATALAKQYDVIVPYLLEQRLDTWTHNKAIQKAVESYRITPEQKKYLKTLKIK
ncbi:MAG: DNA alkylation repair protein [Pseudobutyrivibrio sp.]|nr:DNA alkylation repair protein [Pseudobutyrivibrio sp.]